MPLILYAHPFSSYCWKVLIALHENATSFEPRWLGPEKPEHFTELAQLSPWKKIPLLLDDTRVIFESSQIIDYLDRTYPGSTPLIPQNADHAFEARSLDRIFDSYVMTPMQKIVTDKLRPEADRDAFGVAEARRSLDAAYTWLDKALSGRAWAIGQDFTLADCAATPALFYADWAHPIDARFKVLRDYRARLLQRPSIAQVVDEARPYRSLFPLGAPDRD